MDCGSGGAQTGFVGNDEVFEVDALTDSEPVDVMKNRSDALMGSGGCEKSSGRVFGQISGFFCHRVWE